MGLGAAFKWTLQESSYLVPKELLPCFPLCEEEPQWVPLRIPPGR